MSTARRRLTVRTGDGTVVDDGTVYGRYGMDGMTVDGTMVVGRKNKAGYERLVGWLAGSW